MKLGIGLQVGGNFSGPGTETGSGSDTISSVTSAGTGSLRFTGSGADTVSSISSAGTGSETFTPADYGTCKLWLEADTFTPGATATWVDAMGVIANFTATGSARPSVGSLGSRSAIVLDGTDDAMASAGLLSALIPAGNDFTLVAAESVQSSNTDIAIGGGAYSEAPIIGDSAGYFRAGGRSSQFLLLDVWDGAEKGAQVAFAFNSPAVFAASIHGGTLSVQRNTGTPVTTSSGAVQVLTGTLRLGGIASNFLGQTIGGLFVFAPALDATALASFIARLRDRFAI